MFAAPLAIRSSPFANRRAIRPAIRCRFSMSPDAFHIIAHKSYLNRHSFKYDTRATSLLHRSTGLYLLIEIFTKWNINIHML